MGYQQGPDVIDDEDQREIDAYLDQFQSQPSEPFRSESEEWLEQQALETDRWMDEQTAAADSEALASGMGNLSVNSQKSLNVNAFEFVPGGSWGGGQPKPAPAPAPAPIPKGKIVISSDGGNDDVMAMIQANIAKNEAKRAEQSKINQQIEANFKENPAAS